jgi:outer membrane protein assembly factor BamB
MVGDLIFTMGDKENASHLTALHRSTGTILWHVKVGKAGAPGWGGFAGPRTTPTIDGGVVYTVGQYGEIVAVRVADQKVLWTQHLVDDLGGPLPEWGFSESPLVDGEKVLVTPGGPRGTLAALDKKTGSVIWQSSEWTDPAHYSSIIRATINGIPQYIQLTAANVAAVGVDDGKLLWKAERKGRTAVIPTPIYADNHVYVTSGYGVGCNLFKITHGNGFSAEEVYANKAMANHHGGIIKLGKHLYGHSEGKGWVCQDFLSGETVWAEKRAVRKGAIGYADGRLYCREETDGVMVLLEASPEGFSEKGRFTPPDHSGKKTWPHPTIAGGKLYLRDHDLLHCYDVTAR